MVYILRVNLLQYLGFNSFKKCLIFTHNNVNVNNLIGINFLQSEIAFIIGYNNNTDLKYIIQCI